MSIDKKIDSNELKRFLQNFHVQNFKYYGEDAEKPKRKKTKIEKRIQEELYTGNIELASEDNISDTYSIAEQVYCDRNKAQDYTYIYDAVLNNFLQGFVGIDDITSLYKPDYFVFEWMMHLEYNPQKKSYSYYRDHYIHQARNLYEMYVMMKDFHYFEKCMEQYKSGNSIVACYFRKMVREQMKRETLYTEDVEKQECYIYRYILYASAFVTSAVHDIGYPVEYMNRNIGRIADFLPLSDYFFEKKNAGQKMGILLSDSLLYKITSAQEITKRVNAGDHGAISACILLMKFYMDGKIYSLSPAQKMVVELSAIAVYEHTLKYEILNNHNPEREQNIFEENPFSFLFRVCDDLQEWDRVYFDITKQSNFLVCNKCGTIIKNQVDNKADPKQKYIYSCCCSANAAINKNTFKYRKLAYVEVCTSLEIKEKKSGGNYIVIKMNYDLIKLLQAVAYNQEFARKRATALKELKIMIDTQMGKTPIVLETYLSGNPIAIKTEIMSRYLSEQKEDLFGQINGTMNITKLDDYLNTFEKIIYDEQNEIYQIIQQMTNRIFELNEQRAKRKMLLNEQLKKVLSNNISFYIRMALILYGVQSNKLIQKEFSTKESFCKTMSKMICKNEKIDYEPIEMLIYNCIYYGFDKREITYPFKSTEALNRYENMYQEDKALTYNVDSYINGVHYDNVRKYCTSGKNMEKNIGYDFFSDYDLFEVLWNEVILL